MFYGCCTRFANTCGSAHGSCAVSLGPWARPPPHRLVRTPLGPLSMYVRLTGGIYTLLMPVAQPTAHMRRPLAPRTLDSSPLLAGSPGPVTTPSMYVHFTNTVCAFLMLPESVHGSLGPQTPPLSSPPLHTLCHPSDCPYNFTNKSSRSSAY
jgi:hypothetical protein